MSRYIVLIILGIISIASLLAYAYIPDNTANANDMHPECMLQSPGFKIKFADTSGRRRQTFNILSGLSRETVLLPFTHDTIISGTRYLVIYKGPGLGGPVLQAVPAVTKVRETTYILGTDMFGRDLLSRLILGMRNSLTIGLLAVLVSLLVGVILGVYGGYFGGFIDKSIMWLINVIWSLPTLLIVFGLTLALGKGFWQVFLAIGLTMWVETARVVRAEALSLRHRDFVTASLVLGRSHFGLIIKHIIPNIWPVIWVLAANNFAAAMLIESGLSFLGLGVQPPAPTLGSLLRENYGFIVTRHAYLAFVPGLVLMFLVLLFYQAGLALKSDNNKPAYY